MVVIRLARTGRTKYPVYRIVAADSRRAATGKFVAILGNYNPHTKDLVINADEVKRYLANGAQPSNTVVKLLKREKLELPAWVKLQTKTSAPKKAVAEIPAEETEVTPAEAAADDVAPAEVVEAASEPTAEATANSPEVIEAEPAPEAEATATTEALAPADEERVAEVATSEDAEKAKAAQPIDHTDTAAEDEAAEEAAEAVDEQALEAATAEEPSEA